MLADVEAAGHVVQRDGRDPGDEQPAKTALLRAGLEGGEEVAEEAAPVGERVVCLLAVHGQDGVGEVVVLVDQAVQVNAVAPGVREQLAQPAVDGRRGENAGAFGFREQVAVPLQHVPEHGQAMELELLLQRVERILECGEVEPQDDVAAALVRRVAADVGAAEHRVEFAREATVVVVLQQGDPARLAHPPGADEHCVADLIELAQEGGLVHVQLAVQADASKVGDAVGDAGVAGHGGAGRRAGGKHSRAGRAGRPGRLRIGRALGMTPEFWLNLQRMYDLDVARNSIELGDIERLTAA